MKPAKCPFYPDSCTVEFHPNMQHVWRERIEKLLVVTNIPRATNSERAQAWNKANRKQYNARQKLLMAGKRAKRGG